MHHGQPADGCMQEAFINYLLSRLILQWQLVVVRRRDERNGQTLSLVGDNLRARLKAFSPSPLLEEKNDDANKEGRNEGLTD